MEDFRDYIDNKIEGERMITLSIEEIQKDFNLVIKDVFYLLANLPYRMKLHPKEPGYIVVGNKKLYS